MDVEIMRTIVVVSMKAERQNGRRRKGSTES